MRKVAPSANSDGESMFGGAILGMRDNLRYLRYIREERS